ncbi:putative arginine N-methyltransferase, partial [Gregarina niphandrodes]
MSSPLERNRRDAEPGVQQAIVSVFKNQKFKRMMVFSIKSLSEFCVPPNNRYKENALSVVENPEFPRLLESISLFKEDEEVLVLFGKIFFGVSEGLKDEPRLLNEVVSSGMPEKVVEAMAGGVNDETGIQHYLDCIKNLNTLNIPINMSGIVPGLLQSLKSKMKSPMCLRTLKAIEQSCQEPGVPAMIGSQGGVEKVLAVVAGRKDSPECVVSALKIVGATAKAHKTTPADLEKIINLVDANKNHAGIQKAGSECIAAIVNPDDLKQCLSTLKNSAPESPERENALTLLSSMSYISSCATEIAKGGSIPLVVDALKETVQQLKSKQDAKTHKSVVGITKMLLAVGQSPDSRKTVIDVGGLDALLETLKNVDARKYPRAYKNTVSALATVCVDERTHTKLASVCELVVKNMDIGNEVLPCSAELMRQSGSCPGWGSAKAPEKLAKYASALPEDQVYHESVVGAASQMLQMNAGTSAQLVPMIEAVSKLISASCEHSVVGREAAIFLQKVVEYSPSAAGTDWSAPVEAALALLLTYSDSNPSIASSALSALEALASEKDVSRTLSELELAVNTAKQNPERCLRCLAAVNGLSQLNRLRPAFERQNAAAVIMKGLRTWVESPKYPEQQKIVKYGCQCIDSLVIGSSKPVDAAVIGLLEIVQLPGTKALRDKQDDPTDNSLIDLARSLETLCATHRLGGRDAEIIENLLKCIRKYPEARRAQISFINCLRSLVSVDPENAHRIIDTGVLKSVLAYMSRVAVYQDVQLEGCKFLLAIAQTDERSLAQLKGADALPVVQTAQRTHRSNKDLGHYTTQLIGMLVPEGELERIIQENCRDLGKAMNSGDYKTAYRCLENINAATVSGEGARVAAKCDLGRHIGETQDKLQKCGELQHRVAITEQLAVAAANLAQKPVGANNLIRNGGVKRLAQMWETMGDGSKEGRLAALRAARRCLQKDRNESQSAFAKGWAAKVCAFATQHDDDPEILVETANVMGSLVPQKELLKYEEYRRWLAHLCKKLNEDGPAELKAPLVEALENILLVGDDEVLDIFLKNKGLPGVLKVMDESPHDWPTMKRCNRILDAVNRQKQLRSRLQQKEDLLPALGRVVRKVLQAPKIEVPDVVAHTLRNYNAVILPTDTGLFAEVDLVPEIERIMLEHPDHELLMKACGEYLGKVGCDRQIDSLFRQIVDQCEKKPADWTKNVTKLNNQLAVFLAGEPQRPEDAFKHCAKCMDKLADAARKEPPLLPSIGRVVRRIAKRSRDDPATPHGVPALMPKMMPAFSELLGKDAGKQPRAFLIDGFHALADMARHEPSHKAVVDSGHQFTTIKQAQRMLKTHNTDPEVCAAVLDYLSAICSQPYGAAVLAQDSDPSSRRIGDPAFVDDVMALMKRFNKNKPLLDNAFELLGNMGRNQKKAPAFVADAAAMQDLNDMGKEPASLPALMKMHRNLVGKEPHAATVDALAQLKTAYNNLVADPDVPDDLKAEAAVALAEFIAAATTEAGLTPEERKAGSVKDMVAMFENHRGDIPTLLKMTRA